jgi:hypothetical protein
MNNSSDVRFVRHFYFQIFSLQPPETLVLEVSSRSFVLLMNHQTMVDFGNGLRSKTDADIGPPARFAPTSAGEWYLVSDSQLDGRFRVMRGLR